MISFYGVFLLTLLLEMRKYFSSVSEGYSEPSQTSEIELFEKTVIYFSRNLHFYFQFFGKFHHLFHFIITPPL